MIDQLRLVYPGGSPDLSSADYMALLRDVTRTECWVRYSLLLIGGIIVFGIGAQVLRDYLPNGLFGALPIRHGHFTAAGRVVFACLFAAGFWALKVSRNLFNDVKPYKLPAEVLRQYEVRSGRISGFGTISQFGSQWYKYQRIDWRIESASPMSGRSPFIRSPLVFWLDEGDEVYIGVDPQGRNPPIFLGAKKKAPDALQGWPDPDLAKMFEAMSIRVQTSPRFKGVYVPHYYDKKTKRWVS